MKLSEKFITLNNLSKYIKNGTSIGIGGHHFARLPIALNNKEWRVAFYKHKKSKRFRIY